MGAASSSPTPPSSADADAAASAAAIRRRASARIQEERRRSEDMERRVWGLLADKEDLEAEKRRLLQGGASAAVAAAALGAGALALLQRRHASAMAALRIAATEAQQRHTSELERVRRFGAEPLARSLVPVTLQDTSETLPRHFPRRFPTPPPHNHLPDPLSAFFQTPPSVPARSRTPDPEGPSPSPTNCRPSRTRETASLSTGTTHTCWAPTFGSR
mmetsp:Transcript_8347/g.24755  ORF Transcript_8347/g.24755 Transcript_8347/m.24755 type:complete len:217 (-) Transcript_8347:941-1591(-)